VVALASHVSSGQAFDPSDAHDSAAPHCVCIPAFAASVQWSHADPTAGSANSSPNAPHPEHWKQCSVQECKKTCGPERGLVKGDSGTVFLRIPFY
jgi:hypothetical protein